MRVIAELEFREKINCALSDKLYLQAAMVTGPGRSGAIASVYASHILRIPFIPYKQKPPRIGRMLIIDTATESGKTLRKAERFYADYDPIVLAIYQEPPRVAFWYEREKPQRYRHECRKVADV